jgi:endonuclease YncB( thermonuclease family)
MKKLFQLLTLFTCLTFQSFAQIKIDTVIVTAVHDGDSYRVLYKNGLRQWVRLAYVDCPEVISNHVSALQPYGDSASIKVREIIKGRKMRFTNALWFRFQLSETMILI